MLGGVGRTVSNGRPYPISRLIPRSRESYRHRVAALYLKWKSMALELEGVKNANQNIPSS